MKAKYEEEVRFASRNYQHLNSSKLRQEKESENMFTELERGQVRNVEEIERMY